MAAGYSAVDAGFAFPAVPPPAANDAATAATFTLVDGARDRNGGDLAVLHDGLLPSGEDDPADNFFFRAGTDGGRLRVDLGRALAVQRVGTYSWHANTRGPQVYTLYASDGAAAGFDPAPRKGTDPASRGWTLVARVDTRPKDGDGGGQHGVAVTDSAGAVGTYRYLLFDIAPTEGRDAFGNTFFSEIDVLDANGPAPAPIAAANPALRKSFEAEGGTYHFTIDAAQAPDLAEWSEKELQPVVAQWYPKIVAMLPSDGYRPATNVLVRFCRTLRGVPACTSGATIELNAEWFRGELQREARGSVVHEMVHVVQDYWRSGRNTAPGWLVEGLADYIRWFLYEPQSRGAELTRRNLGEARYDASYRVTGNFLDWVTQRYDRDIVRKLNAAAREGRYSEQVWKDCAGKTVQELGAEWKAFHEQRLSGPAPAAP